MGSGEEVGIGNIVAEVIAGILVTVRPGVTKAARGVYEVWRVGGIVVGEAFTLEEVLEVGEAVGGSAENGSGADGFCKR
jgi:hypothetical protein